MSYSSVPEVFPMVRRGLAVLAALTVGLVALGGSASAQYPPTSVACTVSASVVQQGNSVLFSCTGFAPNSEVAIDDNNGPATLAAARFGGAANGLLAARPLALAVLAAPANGAGTTLVRVKFAKNAPLGTHILKATGVDTNGNAKVGTSAVTVVPAPQAAGLPATGSNSTVPAVAVGFGLVVLGAAIVFASRRYRLVRLNG